jgi:hypothetical protein
MMIHEDQQNVAAFCEVAEFVDSGYQSFREQVKHLSPQKMSEAAFFAGAAMCFRLIDHFQEANEKHGPQASDYLCGLVVNEINEYMERNGLRLEWMPHVPSAWKQ